MKPLRGTGRAPARRGAGRARGEQHPPLLPRAQGTFLQADAAACELLLEYDQNIVKHTQRLNERRITRGEEPIVWKYFQYLTLLFSEIYLDRYFREPKALLKELNAQVSADNSAHDMEDKAEADQLASFDESAEAWPQLNKLAFTPCRMLAQYLPDLAHLWWLHTLFAWPFLGIFVKLMTFFKRICAKIEKISPRLDPSFTEAAALAAEA